MPSATSASESPRLAAAPSASGRARPRPGRRRSPWVRRVPDARLDAHVALLDPLAKHQDLRVVRSGQAVPPVVVHRPGPPGEQDDEAPGESPPRSSPTTRARCDARDGLGRPPRSRPFAAASGLARTKVCGAVEQRGPAHDVAVTQPGVPAPKRPFPDSLRIGEAKASAADASQSAETQWARLRSVIEPVVPAGTRRTG